MKRFERILLIVLDSVGVGALPDAREFGDEGANTLGHIVQRVPSIRLPLLGAMGLGNIVPIPNLPLIAKPLSCYGRMAEKSVGKDTMTGHWELMGLNVSVPFRTFPHGFPREIINALEQSTGRSVIGNIPASGTAIIDQYGVEQSNTGAWIVYTSADSVMQIAAHEDFIPLEELYEACRVARRLLSGDYAVGRVIARPYKGKPGEFVRTSNRHDFAVKPPHATVLNKLRDANLDVIGIGKIGDIFSGEGISESIPTQSNADGILRSIDVMKQHFRGLCFTNLVDFDSLYGHRRDPIGYATALEQFDAAMPSLIHTLTESDLLIITADHGNDPVHPGTDHTREYVPLLVYSPSLQGGVSLGTRSTFADVGATVSQNFGIPMPEVGTSFLEELR